MSKTKLVIEDNVPLPTKDSRGRSIYYPWRDMKIGTSVFIEANPNSKDGKKAISSARTSVSKFGRSNKMRFVAHLTATGLRIWRKT